MNFWLNASFSLSVGLGAIIGWVRFRKTDPAFFPFLLLLSLGLLNELVSIVVMYAGKPNALNYNLFALAEAMLVLWQFSRWGLFKGRRQFFYLLQIIIVAGCAAEWILYSNGRIYNSHFIIGYSLLIVLMSILMINRLLFSVTDPLLREPVFLICTGFCIYFSYTVLVEAFWLYGLNHSKHFRLGIYDILSYINLFTNLLYAYALLWIPLKRQYIMQ
jgi:hypothetical protein